MVAAAVIGGKKIKRSSRIKIGTGLGMVPVHPSTGYRRGLHSLVADEGGGGVVVVMVMVTAMVGSM